MLHLHNELFAYVSHHGHGGPWFGPNILTKLCAPYYAILVSIPGELILKWFAKAIGLQVNLHAWQVPAGRHNWDLIR